MRTAVDISSWRRFKRPGILSWSDAIPRLAGGRKEFVSRVADGGEVGMTGVGKETEMRLLDAQMLA
jgi:hypothetical protein